jgi:apolipoprotein D and lipocalin family protein
VIGNKARDKVWILSRTPQMDPALYDKLLKRIQLNGFDISGIEKTRQEKK